MSYIYIKHHHTLKHDVSRQRVEKVADYLKRKYKVNYTWKGNRLHARHVGCVISADIEEGSIELRIKLSVLLSPMRGKIEKAIYKNLCGVVGDRKGAPAKAILHETV